MSDVDQSGGAAIAAAALKWVSPTAIVRFVAYTPPDGVGKAQVDAAVGSADAASRATFGEDAAEADVVVAALDGVHIRLTKKGSSKARRAWLRELATGLPGGKILRPRKNYGPEPVLQRLGAESPLTVLSAARPGAHHHLMTSARRVLAPPEATAYIASSDAAFGLPDGPEVERVLGIMLGTAPQLLLVGYDDQIADLSWLDRKQLTIRIVDPDGWPGRFEVAKDFLRETACQLDVAFARTGTGGMTWANFYFSPPKPPTTEAISPYISVPALWPTRVVDAYGLQLLTRKHLERAHDLSSWKVTAVEDRYLVQAREPGLWFAESPDPEVIASARADFGEMIITLPELEAAEHARYEARVRAWDGA